MVEPSGGGDPLEGHAYLRTIKCLARGPGHSVVLAQNLLTGGLVAVKLIPRGFDSRTAKYLLRELLNHYELTLSKHPHVVALLDVFLTRIHLAIVLEYVDGENLQVFLEKAGGCIIEPLARFVFQQLMIALDFCHRKGKVSRDIKPSGLLLQLSASTLPLLKMSDFALSKDTLRNSEPKSQVGTAMYSAPEVLTNFNGAAYDGAAADMWAAGVVLFTCLFGRHPFSSPEDTSLPAAEQVLRMFKRVTAPRGSFEGDLLIPHVLPTSMLPGAQPGAPLSLAAADLLRGLLSRDPRARMTLHQVQQHEWFRTGLPEGAALLNEVVAADEASAGAAAVMPPAVSAQLERMVVQAAVGPASLLPLQPQPQPQPQPQQHHPQPLPPAPLGGAPAPLGPGGAGGMAGLPLAPGELTALIREEDEAMQLGVGQAAQHAAPRPAAVPPVPVRIVTTRPGTTTDSTAASVSIGSTVAGAPAGGAAAAPHTPSGSAGSGGAAPPPAPLPLSLAVAGTAASPAAAAFSGAVNGGGGGAAAAALRAAPAHSAAMSAAAPAAPWSPLQDVGDNGGDLFGDLEALVMGMPDDDILSAVSLDFLAAASRHNLLDVQPAPKGEPPLRGSGAEQHVHMSPSALAAGPCSRDAAASHSSIPHASGGGWVLSSAPVSADATSVPAVPSPPPSGAWKPPSDGGAAATSGHSAAPGAEGASPPAAAAQGPGGGGGGVTVPPLFTSLHSVAAMSAGIGADAAAGLLARLRTDSLPSPSTLALIDAKPFLAEVPGHDGGLLRRSMMDSSIVTVPSTYSMDWCALSARSETLLSPRTRGLVVAAATGAGAGSGSSGGQPESSGGSGGAAPAGLGGGDGGGADGSHELLRESMWHRICHDAKVGLGRAAIGLHRLAKS